MSLALWLNSPREEDVQRYLTEHPRVLFRAFGTNLCYNALLPKFRFGTEYVSDFLLISVGSIGSISAWIRLVLIEIEPPTEAPFTKAGLYGRRLNHAMAQVTDWLSWVRANDAYFRASMSKALGLNSAILQPRFAARGIDPYLSGTDAKIAIPNPKPSPDGDFDFEDHMRLALSKAVFLLSAKIIIGRRAMLTQDANRKRATLFVEAEQKIEIVPYDRLLDAEIASDPR